MKYLIGMDISKCYYCERIFGQENGHRTKDHVIPLSVGGAYKDAANIVPCCTDCNKNKGGFYYGNGKSDYAIRYGLMLCQIQIGELGCLKYYST